MRFYLFIFIGNLLIGYNAIAQVPVFEWAAQMGNPQGLGGGSGLSITGDKEGNLITAGVFDGTLDFDPGPDTVFLRSKGFMDIFIQKLDSLGNLIWVKQIGGEGIDGARREFAPAPFIIYNLGLTVNVDDAGNIITTGTYGSNFYSGTPIPDTVDFDPGAGVFNLTTAGGPNVFIQKLDPDGNFLWAKRIGGNIGDAALSSTMDINRNIYVTGYFRGKADMDTSPSDTFFIENSAGSLVNYADIFILKLDSSGNFIWVRQLGGILQDEGRSIKTDAYGNVLIAGTFNSIVDFDPGPEIYEMVGDGLDIFILKLDSSGTFLWATQTKTNSLYFVDIDLDRIGNIFLTGRFEFTTDFDPGPALHNLSAIGWHDLFIQKTNPDGAFVWVKVMGGVQCLLEGKSIHVDDLGNIRIAGIVSGNADIDPGQETHEIMGSHFAFLLKLDSLGDYDGSAIFDCSNYGGMDYIDVFSFNNKTYLTGDFYSTTDLDPGPATSDYSAVGPTDVFVLKLKDDIDIITGKHPKNNVNGSIVIFPNPGNGHFTINMGREIKSSIVTISSIEGKFIQEEIFFGKSSHNIDLNADPGIYILKVETDNHTAFFKIIKQ